MSIAARKQRRRIFVLMALLAVLGALWFLPKYRQFERNRAASRAIRCLEKGDDAAASISAIQALQSDSNNIPACRVMAQLAGQGEPARALYWRKRLLNLEPANVSNRLAIAQLALRIGDRLLARKTLESVPESSQNASFHQIAAKLAFSSHDLDNAEKHLGAAQRLDPSNPAPTINLAIVQLHSPDSNRVRTARETLEARQSDPLHGGEILRALIAEAVRWKELDRARGLSARLLERQDAEFRDRLLHLAILHDLGTSAGEREFDALLAGLQVQATGHAEQTAELLTWMAGHGQSTAAMHWIDRLPRSLRRASVVRRAETRCYIAAEKWGALTAFLERSQWGSEDYLRHAFLALGYRRQGDEALAQVEWKRAVRAGLPAGTVALIRLAGAWGWESEAEELLWDTVRQGGDSSWALSLLARAYQIQGDTASLLRVFEAAAGKRPGDLLLRNNIAAACLLLRTNLPAAHEAAREVHLADRRHPGFACTYGYSLHLQGRTREGLEVLGRLPEHVLREPSVAACYGAMLRSQGALDKAEDYLALARQGRLLPEERALVEAVAASPNYYRMW